MRRYDHPLGPSDLSHRLADLPVVEQWCDFAGRVIAEEFVQERHHEELIHREERVI